MLAKPILILLSVFAAAGPALGMTVFTIKAGVVSGRKGPISLYVTDAGGRPAVPSRLDMGGATAPLTWVDFNANPFKFDVMLDGKLWSKVSSTSPGARHHLPPALACYIGQSGVPLTRVYNS